MLTYKEFKEHLQLQEGVNDPGIFKIVFTAGGPGSGKSFIAGKTGLTSMGLRVVNSDDIYEKKLEAAFEKSMNDISSSEIMSDKGQEIRVGAKALLKKKEDILIDGRIGLLVDGTGKDVDKIRKQKAGFEKLGYECMMIFVNTTLETSIERDKQRSRTVGAAAVEKMWSKVQKNIGAFPRLFGNKDFVIVDNTQGKDFNRETMQAYKIATKFISSPPKTRAAKRWIANEMKKRGISKKGK